MAKLHRAGRGLQWVDCGHQVTAWKTTFQAVVRELHLTAITQTWLDQRGGLHDARVLGACSKPNAIRITIDDEWASEHEEADAREPGTLILRGVTGVRGSVAAAIGGWISEVSRQGDEIVFDFCDRERLIIQTSDAIWEPDSTS